MGKVTTEAMTAAVEMTLNGQFFISYVLKSLSKVNKVTLKRKRLCEVGDAKFRPTYTIFCH